MDVRTSATTCTQGEGLAGPKKSPAPLAGLWAEPVAKIGVKGPASMIAARGDPQGDSSKVVSSQVPEKRPT